MWRRPGADKRPDPLQPATRRNRRSAFLANGEGTCPAARRACARPFRSDPIIVAYGAGVDSTAMLIGLRDRRVEPTLILFANPQSALRRMGQGLLRSCDGARSRRSPSFTKPPSSKSTSAATADARRSVTSRSELDGREATRRSRTSPLCRPATIKRKLRSCQRQSQGTHPSALRSQCLTLVDAPSHPLSHNKSR